ncbi:MAG: pentapeptide repeat-containing protein [Synechococcus sp. Tobar2m-G35]|jgi:uncharacterized protein YjbI with pentapeptide repeats|nr:pentapeptide repeat-containing protein [Synechococcus sp. Tobar2m-G35]
MHLLALLLALLLPLTGAAEPVWARSYLESIDYTLTNQSGVDFHGQDLEGSSFAGAVGRQADFSGAQLHGAIFTQAAMAGADFHGADLSDALMDRADFAATDLRDALLSGVIASGSSFTEARIEGADFSDALLDRADRLSLCRRASGRHPQTGIETRLSLDCP